MSTQQNDTAFPLPPDFASFGLSKREYFAAMAMNSQAMSTADFTLKEVCKRLGINEAQYDPEIHYHQYVAMESVRLADALIEQLNK